MNKKCGICKKTIYKEQEVTFLPPKNKWNCSRVHKECYEEKMNDLIMKGMKYAKKKAN